MAESTIIIYIFNKKSNKDYKSAFAAQNRPKPQFIYL